MSRIRGADTVPERLVRSFLHRLGLRFRVNDTRLPGRPDVVLPRARTVIFVHGCFWHRHAGCSYATTPSSNEAFWREKFAANVQRDARTVKALEDAGWRVEIVWQCEIWEVGRLEQLGIELLSLLDK